MTDLPDLKHREAMAEFLQARLDEASRGVLAGFVFAAVRSDGVLASTVSEHDYVAGDLLTTRYLLSELEYRQRLLAQEHDALRKAHEDEQREKKEKT